MKDKLFKLYLNIYTLVENKGHNKDFAKDFKSSTALFNSWYKKANNFEQGEYHYLVHLFYKGRK